MSPSYRNRVVIVIATCIVLASIVIDIDMQHAVNDTISEAHFLRTAVDSFQCHEIVVTKTCAIYKIWNRKTKEFQHISC